MIGRVCTFFIYFFIRVSHSATRLWALRCPCPLWILGCSFRLASLRLLSPLLIAPAPSSLPLVVTRTIPLAVGSLRVSQPSFDIKSCLPAFKLRLFLPFTLAPASNPIFRKYKYIRFPPSLTQHHRSVFRQQHSLTRQPSQTLAPSYKSQSKCSSKHSSWRLLLPSPLLRSLSQSLPLPDLSLKYD
jgi:hypothetical protein